MSLVLKLCLLGSGRNGIWGMGGGDGGWGGGEMGDGEVMGR